MLKKNRKKMLLSSIVILLPILAGLLLWEKLPERVAVHWDTQGNPDNWAGRPFAVFGLPLFLLAIHWLGMLVTARDPGNREQSGKVLEMVFWICPVISLLGFAVIYAWGLGFTVDFSRIVLLLLGAMFVFIGNYLPKCRKNSTIGIKLPWTLSSEANWHATHRFSGKVWIIGGILLALSALLPKGIFPWVMLSVLGVLAGIPAVYSYVYHKRNG